MDQIKIDQTVRNGIYQRIAPRPVLVLGVGNILLRDEGVGVRVVEAMRSMDLPSDVELFDGGTSGLDLLDIVADRHKVVVIDAVQADNEPGSLVRLGLDDFTPETTAVVSLHQVGLLETLLMAKHLGCAPEQVVIYGIEPKDMGFGLALSPEVAAVVPSVIELVLPELGM